MIFFRYFVSFAALWILCFSMPASAAVVIKLATLSPEGSFWMNKMRQGADEVALKTENRVKIKFYPGGVMGDDKTVLRKMRIGQLHGGAMVSGSVASFFPDCQIYALPFFFRSFEEVDYVRGKMDPMIEKGLEENGLVSFGLAEGGFAYTMSREPIRTVSDMRNQKVWVPDNDESILHSVKPYGINPIPLGLADVRAGLQTGLINTVTAPPIGAIILQWHTQIEYILDEPFLYIYAVLVLDKKAFSRIDEKDRPIVRKIMGGVFSEIDRQNRKDNLDAMETVRKHGIQFIKAPESALAEWHGIAEQVPEKLIAAGKLTRDAVTTMEKHLTEYRAKKDGK